MNKYIVLMISMLSLLLLAACTEKDDALEKVKIAEVTRSIFYTPQYVAIEKGFFNEQGLDIELTTTWGGDKTMTALLSDHADVALVGSETSVYVYGQESKDPIINFAQLTQTDGTFLVAKEPHDAFEWEQMKDSIFLGQRKGGMPQMVGEFVLKKHQIDPHGDLTLIQNIEFANIPGAFASGDAAYVQLFEPTATIFEKEGNGHIIASFGEEAGNIPYTVFMTKESTIENNLPMVEKFTAAIYAAQQWVKSADAKEVATVIAPYFEDVDLDIIEQSVIRYQNQQSFAHTPILEKAAWENLLDIMDEAGELQTDAPYEKLVNTKIAEKVMKQFEDD